MPTLQTRPNEYDTSSKPVESCDIMTDETIQNAAITALITVNMVAETLAKAMSEKPPLAALNDIAAQESIKW